MLHRPTTIKKGYKDDLSLMMIVEDQARQAVLFLPFFPGC
jgi:hypothetical protein